MFLCQVNRPAKPAFRHIRKIDWMRNAPNRMCGNRFGYGMDLSHYFNLTVL